MQSQTVPFHLFCLNRRKEINHVKTSFAFCSFGSLHDAGNQRPGSRR